MARLSIPPGLPHAYFNELFQAIMFMNRTGLTGDWRLDGILNKWLVVIMMLTLTITTISSTFFTPSNLHTITTG